MLTIFDRSIAVANFFDLLLRNVDELANHCVQQSGLTRARSSNNDSKRSLLDIDIKVLEIKDLFEGAILVWNLRLLLLAAAHVVAGLADLTHTLSSFFILLLLKLLADLVLVSLVEFWGHTVREVTLDAESILTISFLLAIDEAFLGLGRAIKLPKLLHAFHQGKVLAVEMLAVVDPTFEAAEHLLCEGKL